MTQPLSASRKGFDKLFREKHLAGHGGPIIRATKLVTAKTLVEMLVKTPPLSTGKHSW